MIVTVKLGWANVFIKRSEVNCLNLIVVLSQNTVFVSAKSKDSSLCGILSGILLFFKVSV